MLQEINYANMVSPSMLQPIPVLPTHNKEMRAEAIASAQNNKQVDLPEDAPWKEEFVRELEEFPLSEHDDCVDAYTWAQAGFVRGAGFFKPLEEGASPFGSDLVTIEDPQHPFFDGGDVVIPDEEMSGSSSFALQRSSRSLDDVMCDALDPEREFR
jgi:hypothetical protein